MRTSAWVVGWGGLAALLAWASGAQAPAGPVGHASLTRATASSLEADTFWDHDSTSGAPASEPWPRLPLLIAENRGQVDGPARYVASLGRLTAHLLDDRIALQLVGGCPDESESTAIRERPASGAEEVAARPAVRGANVHLRFEHAQPSRPPVGESRLPTVLSFFRGNDPSRWITRVPCFEQVRYEQSWPGIDVIVRGAGGRLEYDLLLEPGADLARAVIAVEGTSGLSVAEDGSLLIETAAGTLQQPPPRTWEVGRDGTTRLLACAYRLLEGHSFGFEAPEWSGRRPLVVDPEIVWGTYLGGSGLEEGEVINVDPEGSAVIGGDILFSGDFPATPGAFDIELGNQFDAFVARFSPGGESLDFAAFIGGNSNSEDVSYLEPMPDGSLIVHGGTGSTDFPVTAGAFATTLSGVNDLFVMRIAPDGGSLIYSTLIGGDANDIRGGCSVDALERVILTGDTYSTDFPVTTNAAEPTMDGHDMFITCLSADGSSLEYSSFVVWSGSIQSLVSTLRSDGRVVAAGRTASPSLPVTAGAFDTSWNGATDLFVMCFDPAFQIEWCTYLGGGSDEWSNAIAVDASGCVYVAGETTSPAFPTTPGAFDAFKSGISDAYISKLSADGSTLEYSTLLGGSSNDIVFGLAIDGFGCAVVAGGSGPGNFPQTADSLPFGPASFLTRLSPDGSHLWTSTLLGDPTTVNDIYGLALGPDGRAYVTGFTWSTQLPGTEGAFDDTLDGTSDCFVLKVDLAAWTDLGQGLAPVAGAAPRLVGHGELLGGNPLFLRLTDAPPASLAYLLLGVTAWNAPFKGGTLVPAADPPFGLALPLATDAGGTLYVPAVWPPGLPHGVPVYAQYWLPDPAGPHGFTASNAVVAITVE